MTRNTSKRTRKWLKGKTTPGLGVLLIIGLVDIEDDAVIFRYPEDGDDKKHVKKNPEMVEG